MKMIRLLPFRQFNRNFYELLGPLYSFLKMSGFPPKSLTLLALVASILSVVAIKPAAAQGDLKAAIKTRLSSEGGPLADWYKKRNYEPVWDGNQIQALAEFLRKLDAHGLRPELFRLAEWETTWLNPPRDSAGRADVEIGSSHLALFAIQSLAYGFVDPTTVHPKWKAIPRGVSAYRFLEEALKQSPRRFAPYLEDLAAPTDTRYDNLVQTLDRYRKIGSYGGWKPLPSTARPVSPGESYPSLALLRARLKAEGDLNVNAEKTRSKVLDGETATALKSFQFRHGIEPDAVIGPSTLTELNAPTQARIDSLIINIDRLRWMPRDYEQSERLEANIGEGVLRLLSNRRSVTSMPIIVGKKSITQTPVFHGDVKYLTFRPYWNIPLSIAKDELVPAALSNPAYMAKNNYEIVNGYGDGLDQTLPASAENLNKVAAGTLRMRQATGPENALGLVKFIFPNDSAVYLHDTPDHSLFERTDRDFSHGCVRVSRPADLAELLLRRNGGWDINSVETAMNDASNPNHRVDFSTAVPVFLVYWTSTIMDDSRVRFDQDIYGHDAVMREKFGLEQAAIFRQ